MRSTAFLTMLFAMPLASGCSMPDPTPDLPPAGPDFCVVEEPRRFTQAELDWRSANAPANLRRDLKTNGTGKAECGWTGAAG